MIFKLTLLMIYIFTNGAIDIHSQINQVIQMFKCFYSEVSRQIIATKMAIKLTIIIFFGSIYYFVISNTYKKVICFSTSYGNLSRPCPVQFMWIFWHWQLYAILEHIKSEIHNCQGFSMVSIKTIYKLTTFVFIVPSKITVHFPIAYHRLMYTRSSMTFIFIIHAFWIDLSTTKIK